MYELLTLHLVFFDAFQIVRFVEVLEKDVCLSAEHFHKFENKKIYWGLNPKNKADDGSIRSTIFKFRHSDYARSQPWIVLVVYKCDSRFLKLSLNIQ